MTERTSLAFSTSSVLLHFKTRFILSIVNLCRSSRRWLWALFRIRSLVIPFSFALAFTFLTFSLTFALFAFAFSLLAPGSLSLALWD